MGVGGADPLGRGFPLIQVCAEGERGGQKTDILQLLLPPPMGVVAVRGAAFSLWRRFFFFKKNIFRFALFGIFGHVLAEVVVCAVGWVVTLPAMEMTAQATALLVLVSSLQPKERFMKPAVVSVVFYGFKQVMHALEDVSLACCFNHCNFVLFRRNITAAVLHLPANVSYFRLIK